MCIPFPFFVHYLHRIKDDGYGNGVGSMKIGRKKKTKNVNGMLEKRKVCM
jgi:hypothetical protein